MLEYMTFLNEGTQYLKAAQGKNGQPSKLSGDIQYNLLALSLEKCIMAILMFNNDLADNHTFTDLLHAVVKYVPIPQELRDEIIALENVQSICNIYEYHREIPSGIVIARLAAVVVFIHDLAGQVCRISDRDGRLNAQPQTA